MNAATAKVKLAPQRQREEMMNDECEMMNIMKLCRYIHHSSFRIHRFPYSHRQRSIGGRELADMLGSQSRAAPPVMLGDGMRETPLVMLGIQLLAPPSG